MKPLRVATWLGIGDCHWVATKLRGLSEAHDGRPIHAYVNCGPFHDSVGFLEIVPFVAKAERSKQALLRLEDVPGGYLNRRWSTLEGAAGWRGFDYLLIANGHLERGLPLDSWMEGLPTDYTYPLAISDSDRERALNLAPKGSVLLYPSGTDANRGFHANWWTPERWADVVRLLNAEGIAPVFIGAPTASDMAYRAMVLERCAGLEFTDVIGQTTIPQVLALIENAAVWCGLNSGTGIVAAMRGTPTVMLWSDARFPIKGRGHPGLHPAMQRSWLSREQLATYRTHSYGDPELTPEAVVSDLLSVRRN